MSSQSVKTRPAPATSYSILDAMADPGLFAPWFTPVASWAAWRAFLAALFGLAMTEADAAFYRTHTGRSMLPTAAAREAWLVVGRRGGKSMVAALIAVFLACFRDYRDVLKPGERGTVMILAADRKQARTVLGYVRALLEVPMLARMADRRTAEAIHLTNRITIEVHTASYRAVCGYTVVAAILDEVAFWYGEDSASPDTEVVTALRPAMLTVREPLLLGISSPYARRGVLWEAYRDHYGQDDDPVLVWQAATRDMHPSIDERIIAAEYEKDAASARAEYGAEFRTDIEGFLTREMVEACVIPGRRELPPVPGARYVAFVDPSGAAEDSMTLAVAHEERGRVLLDLVRERRPPFSPEGVVQEFADICRSYRASIVHGDRYGGEWPRERFEVHRLGYRTSDLSKSELYHELLPLLTSREVDLLDHPRLIAQLVGLERHTGRAGKDMIAPPRAQHDDVANAVAGALVLAAQRGQAMFAEFAGRGPVRWTCETCGGPTDAFSKCPVCDAPRCPKGHAVHPNGRCWTCEGPPGPTRRDLGLGW
jgi:hypothetical protein